MNGTTPQIIQKGYNSYCSQPRTSLPPFCTSEEGVKLIEDILKRSILCRHDVKEINKIYRTINHFERQGQIADCSQRVLEKIVEKIEQIAQGKNLLGLISSIICKAFRRKGYALRIILSVYGIRLRRIRKRSNK